VGILLFFSSHIHLPPPTVPLLHVRSQSQHHVLKALTPGGEARTPSGNVQAEMVLLPDTLDCDLGLMEMQEDIASEKLSHHNADAIRL
jgi:hypothetical protein